MAMAVTYMTVNGELVHESRGGVETFYTSDPLGSRVGGVTIHIRTVRKAP